ncbi:unnamed protein product [Nesidiocoris tenuis]|uniref:Uncharacterized protein n=1 Tax=Nesidiocoris tenuis TaxID=355587 RepID=A0A6H5H1V7_9HEMI|nr:unnamed protein product [Nesidiocoris tenuis]
MDIKPPRKKKNAHRSSATRAPLPIFVQSPYGFFTDDSLAPVFRGYFNGYSVVVDNADEMKMLFEMGCFGKGSLSRSFPNFGQRKKEHPPVIFETQWQRRKEWIDRLQKTFGCQLINDEPLEKPDSGSAKSDTNPSEACSSSTGEKGEESEKCSSTGPTEVIVCQVRWPSTDPEVYKSPEIIQHFRVKDCTLGRWNPTSNLSTDTDD